MVTGPTPVYSPWFTEAHLAEARRGAAPQMAGSLWVLRARRVLLFAAEPGISPPAVARRGGVQAQTVRTWRKRWATEGVPVVAHPRSGHPPACSPSAGHAREGRRG